MCTDILGSIVSLRWTEMAPTWKLGEGQARQSACKQHCATMKKYTVELRKGSRPKDSEKERVSISFISIIRRTFLRNFSLFRKYARKYIVCGYEKRLFHLYKQKYACIKMQFQRCGRILSRPMTVPTSREKIGMGKVWSRWILLNLV